MLKIAKQLRRCGIHCHECSRMSQVRKMHLKEQLQNIKMEKGTIISDYVAK